LFPFLAINEHGQGFKVWEADALTVFLGTGSSYYRRIELLQAPTGRTLIGNGGW